MAIDINIRFTDQTSGRFKSPFTVLPGEANTSATSLTLLGQGAPNYSSVISQNLLHIMENFSSSVEPPHATVGQLWYNSIAKELRVLASIDVDSTGTRSNNWQAIGTLIIVGSVAPTDTTRLWYDTSAASPTSHELKIYNTIAQQWQPVSKRTVWIGSSAPVDTSMLWYNTSPSNLIARELYVYDSISSTWHTAVSHDASLLTGNVPDTVLTVSNIGGNAATSTTAVKLATSRTISLSGGAAATGTFDGSADLTLNVTALNASTLTSGTVPVARLGDSGTRASGYYLDGTNVWKVLPPPPDSYTKTQSDVLLATKPDRDSITAVGFASNNTDLPYMRRASDNAVYYLQPRLGFTPQAALGYTPVRQSTANTLYFGWDGTGIAATVDSTYMGHLMYDANLPRNTVAGSNEFGWWKCGDTGLIRAWGISPRIQPGQSIAVSFPIAFTTGRPMVTMGWYNDGQGSAGDPTEVGAAMTSVSNTGFVIYARRFSGSSTDWLQFMYIAEGW